MRSSRFIAILVALMFTATVPMASAQATPTAVAAKAKPAHNFASLSAGGVGTFYVKGQVTTYKNRSIKLQRKLCKRCAFKAFKAKRTGPTGRFKFNFDSPAGSCFRVAVPATRNNRTTVRKVGCITRR